MKLFLYHNDWYDLFLGLLIGIVTATIFWVTIEFNVMRTENKAQRQIDFANGEQHIINVLMAEKK
jgi:hypothetical protein